VRIKVPRSAAASCLKRETRPACKSHYATLVGVKGPSLVTLINKIEDGLSYPTFEEHSSLPDTPAIGLAVLLPVQAAARALAPGLASPQPQPVPVGE
jgi:hypothetical protein